MRSSVCIVMWLTLPHLRRAVGRLRTALQTPSEALPQNVQQIAQQKRLHAVSNAVSAISDHLYALRAAADKHTSQSALLIELLSSCPAPEHAASQLVDSLAGALLQAAACCAVFDPKLRHRRASDNVQALLPKQALCVRGSILWL